MRFHWNCEQVCAVIGVVLAVVSLIVSIISFNIAKITYNHSAKDFNVNLVIEKKGNIITIKNKDKRIFDIYDVCVSGVDSYMIKDVNEKSRVELQTFHYKNKNIDGGLNKICIDTNIIYQNNDKHIDTQGQNDFNNNLTSKINSLKEKGYAVDYSDTCYYIYIAYYNKYDFSAKTLYIRCPIKENGEIRSKTPWNTNQKEENYFDLILRHNQFEDCWTNVEKYIKNIK